MKTENEQLKITAGEWYVNRESENSSNHIMIEAGHMQTICCVDKHDYDQNFEHEANANAILIASAPKLLAFAQMIQAICNNQIDRPTGIDFKALLRQANEVIKKATE